MIQVLKEVTDWDVPNHTYYVNQKSKLVAYIKEGTEELIKLDVPLSFSKTHRRFKKLGHVDGI